MILEKFPYYIVRFKPPLLYINFMEFFSFHTTQYDLNLHNLLHVIKPPFSFHTTQYDLNLKKHMKSLNLLLFPYYIVRFKRKQKKYFCDNQYEFPYYIVRFKPQSASQNIAEVYICFHTTQYDLNFPYYIKFISINYSFHTTQYDLN